VILATRNTLIIATVSTIVATIIGTMAALALQRYRFPGHNVAESGLYIPVIIPEVVMGISLLAFFASIGLTLGWGALRSPILLSAFHLSRWWCAPACTVLTNPLKKLRWTWGRMK